MRCPPDVMTDLPCVLVLHYPAPKCESGQCRHWMREVWPEAELDSSMSTGQVLLESNSALVCFAQWVGVMQGMCCTTCIAC